VRAHHTASLWNDYFQSIVITQPTIFLSDNRRDPLPEAEGDIVLFRTNGDRLIRKDGKWKKISTSTSAGSESVRANLPAKIWKRVNFPGTYAVRPSYTIECRGIDDENRKIFFETRNRSITSMEIKANEACSMELNIFSINGETIL
jgi:hypothetical protein